MKCFLIRESTRAKWEASNSPRSRLRFVFFSFLRSNSPRIFSVSAMFDLRIFRFLRSFTFSRKIRQKSFHGGFISLSLSLFFKNSNVWLIISLMALSWKDSSDNLTSMSPTLLSSHPFSIYYPRPCASCLKY